jgi:flagellin
MQSLSTNSFFSTSLNRSFAAVERSQIKLSTGQRINRAADDPAALSIADGMKAMVQGSQQAARNLQDAINLVRIGEDGVAGMFPVFHRMKELAVQAANGTMSGAERDAVQNEIDEIKALIPQAFFVAHSARINLDGKDVADRVLHIQAGPSAGEMISIDYNPLRDKMRAAVMDLYGYEELYNSSFQEFLAGGFGSPIPKPTDPVPPIPPYDTLPPGTTFADAFPKKIDVRDGDNAKMDQTMKLLDDHLFGIVAEDAYLGAVANRLETTLENVMMTETNLASVESQIRDADFAAEFTRMTQSQVVQQSAQAMLAQSNQRPFQVLELLKGGGR